jgi:hypothetical protein
MKYVAIIFSLYFSLLAIMPCQDRDDMIANTIHAVIKKSHAANERACQETCPPFCTCSCCSIVRNLTTKIVFDFSTYAYAAYAYAKDTTPAVQKQTVAIWQPPQLG